MEVTTPQPRFTLKTLKEAFEIFSYVKPYRWYFIFSLVFISFSSITTLSVPFLLNQMVKAAKGPVTITLGHRQLVTAGPGGIALIILGVLTIQMVFSFLRIYLTTYVGEHAMADMRRDIYKRMITMPMNFFAERRVGELTTRISADITQIQDLVSGSFAEMLRGILTLIIGLGLIFYYSASLALVMLSVVPLIVICGVIFGKRIRKLSRNTQDMLAESGTIVTETLQGIGNVKSFSNEGFEIRRYSLSLKNMVDFAVKNSKTRGLFVGMLLFSIFSSIVLVVWYGSSLIAKGQLTIEDMITFVLYTAFVGGTMAGFAELFSQLQKGIGATQRIREIFREVPESVTLDNNPVAPEYRLNGVVDLQYIAFNYPSRKEIPVLKNISIHAGKGQKIAVVGPSGAGKSTIIALLLRFYEPMAGQILFDGKPADYFPISDLRKQMALVPQDVMLFGGSIYENIAYGKDGATLQEVMDAAQKANAHDFIMSFPEGYDTIVGERGIKLSGGQRQRIAIARAILKDPVILLLDEATSSLDSESEYLVQEALNKLMEGRTSFVVAHRLSTIRNADNIIVLDDGHVVESGTHQELVNMDEGLYKNLSRLQMEDAVREG